MLNFTLFQWINNSWTNVSGTDIDGTTVTGTPIDFGTINLGGESQVIQLAVKANPGYRITSATMPIVPSGTASSCLAVSADNVTWNTYGTNVNITITNPTDYNIFYIKRNVTGENAGNGITDVGVGINIQPSDCTLIPTLSTPAITANSPSAGNIFIQVATAAVSNVNATILYDFHDDVGDLLLGNVSSTNATAGQTISVPAGTYNVYAVAKDATDNLTAQSNTVTGVVVAQPVNNAPVISSVTISGSGSVGATLTANVTGSDPDQYDTVTYTYQWNRNGVAITGSTAQTYTLVSADGGNTITVTATPTDNHGLSGNPVTSAGVSVATVNNPPVISNLDWSDALAGTGSKVILYGSASDPENETITQIDFAVDQNSTYDPNAGTGANATYHYTKSITAIADIQAFQTSGYTWSTPGWPNSTGTYYLWARASDASGIGQYVQCGTTVKVSQSAVADPTITASMDATGNITVSVTNAGGVTSPVYDILVDNIVKATGITPVSNYSLGTAYTDKNPHYVRVRARSGSSGTAVWDSNTVTVTLPDVQPTALASNQISIANVTGTGLTLAVSGSPSTDSDDPTATITYLVDIDDNTFATPTEYTWAQLASVAISQSLVIGSHTLYIKAKAVTGAKTEYSAITGVTFYASGIKSISATGGNNQVTLNYTGSGASGATYNVYRGTTSGTETLLVSGVTANPYIDTTAVNGTQYFYKMTEVVGGAESALSSEVSAAPLVNNAGVGSIESGTLPSTWTTSISNATYNSAGVVTNPSQSGIDTSAYVVEVESHGACGATGVAANLTDQSSTNVYAITSTNKDALANFSAKFYIDPNLITQGDEAPGTSYIQAIALLYAYDSVGNNLTGNFWAKIYGDFNVYAASSFAPYTGMQVTSPQQWVQMNTDLKTAIINAITAQGAGKTWANVDHIFMQFRVVAKGRNNASEYLRFYIDDMNIPY